MYDVKTRARQLSRAERRSRHESRRGRPTASTSPSSVVRVCRSGSRTRRGADPVCRRPRAVAAVAAGGASRGAERPRRGASSRASGAPGAGGRPRRRLLAADVAAVDVAARRRRGAAAQRAARERAGLLSRGAPERLDADADGRGRRDRRGEGSVASRAGRPAVQQHQRDHVGRRYGRLLDHQPAEQRRRIAALLLAEDLGRQRAGAADDDRRHHRGRRRRGRCRKTARRSTTARTPTTSIAATSGRVPTAGGMPQQITTGDGIENVPVVALVRQADCGAERRCEAADVRRHLAVAGDAGRRRTESAEGDLSDARARTSRSTRKSCRPTSRSRPTTASSSTTSCSCRRT